MILCVPPNSDECQRGSWLGAPGNVRGRFGCGWHATLVPPCLALGHQTLLSFAKVNGPARLARTVLNDTWLCQQRGPLSPFRLNPLSIWFRRAGDQNKNVQLFQQQAGVILDACRGLYEVLFHTGIYYGWFQRLLRPGLNGVTPKLYKTCILTKQNTPSCAMAASGLAIDILKKPERIRGLNRA